MSGDHDPVEGAVIVDSVVISNSKVRFHDNVVSIPVKSLATGEASVVVIDKRAGVVRISRGPLHGSMSHDALVESIELDEKRQKNSPKRYSSVHRESFKL